MKPTIQQQAVLDWVRDEQGNLFLDSAAGTGKSSTLCMVTEQLAATRQWKSKDVVYLAFGKGNAKDFAGKIQGIGGSKYASRTLHSLGRGAVFSGLKKLGKTLGDPDGTKYRKIAQEYWSNHRAKLNPKIHKVSDLAFQLKKVVDLTRLTMLRIPYGDELRYSIHLHAGWNIEFEEERPAELTEEELLRRLVRHYSLDIDLRDSVTWPLLVQGVKWCIEKGRELLLSLGKADQTDWIFMPVYLGWKPKRYDFLMIDEAQDLNMCQIELVQMAKRYDFTRLLFVGDPRQAIMGFAGADTESVKNIIRICQCKVLPLSVCWRCPVSHLNLARQIVPKIQNAPSAQLGIVKVIKPSEAFSLIKEMKKENQRREIYVVGRTSTPLVKRTLGFIQDGVRAIMLGRNIGGMMIDLVKSLLSPEGFAYIFLQDILEEYRVSMTLLYSEMVDDPEQLISDMNDKVDTTLTLLWGYKEECLNKKLDENIKGFLGYINNFFEENEDEEGNQIDLSEYVILCTTHKAKGLEAEVVFINDPDNFPHPASKGGWQLEQEYNLLYVALTRAKEEMYFITQAPADINLPAANPKTLAELDAMPLLLDSGDDLPGMQLLDDSEEAEEAVQPAMLEKKKGRPAGTKTAPEKVKKAEEKAARCTFSAPPAIVAVLGEWKAETSEKMNELIIRCLMADPTFAAKVEAKEAAKKEVVAPSG